MTCSFFYKDKMPKSKKDAVHRHFIFDTEANYSQCQLCNAKIKGKHATNLKNHISVKHKETYEDVIRLNNETESRVTARNQTYEKHKKIEERIALNCLKIVTIHGRPFQYLEDEALQDIIDVALPSNIKEKSNNILNIKSMLADKAYEIRSKISKEVHRKLICLKLDAATCQYRSFIGINAQYIKEGKIVIRVLATEEVSETQTGEFLKQTLEDVLNNYKIDKTQIYCITTDNGKNFKKMVKLLGGSYNTFLEEDEVDSNSEVDEDEAVQGEADMDIERLAVNLTESDIERLAVNLIEPESSFAPRTMLCAAHTLQLSVKDAIESNNDVQVLLGNIRRIMTILRTPTMRNIIKAAKLKQPILDCPTRWSSTYKMLLRFQSFRTIFVDNEDVLSLLGDSSWQTIDELVDCLKPVHDATLKLQKEQLTLGDFFIEWLACRTHVEQCRTSFGRSLLDSMTRRQEGLLNTNLMLEALYVDTRLNLILTDTEARKARQMLHETFNQIQRVKASNHNESTLPSIEHSNSNQEILIASDATADTSAASTSVSVVEQILNQTELTRGQRGNSMTTTQSMLLEIRSLQRLSVQENIITYWCNKITSSEMSELALSVLAAPATQVSVERLFSSLKFILSPLRSNLSRNTIADIMVIRNNKDLFDD